MRRLSVLAFTVAMLAGAAPAARAQGAKPTTTFDGEIALWNFGIKPDQTAAYEKVIAKLREALMKSEKPEAKQMLAGWKVMRGVTNPQTGHVIYTHIIYPVVKGADYTITALIYSVFKDPQEQLEIFELYKSAFGAALGANVGTIVADFSKP
jgi:hypothetical protein